MKINLNKSAKRALSLVLSIAMLIGSLFTANVGIGINADALDSTTVTDTWEGDIATGFASGTGTSSDPYIIETPEQLAYLAKGADGQTAGMYYKVADNQVFNMSGLSGITLDSTLNDVQTASPTGNNWGVTFNNSGTTAFAGIFEGNGLVVYNLYGKSWAMGLFPCIDGNSSGNTIVRNVTIKNSWLEAQSGDYTYCAGGIIGTHLNDPRNGTLVEGCSVINCNMITGAKTNSTTNGSGAIAGSIPFDTLTIANCLVANNSTTAADTSTTNGGLVGQAGGTINVNNTVIIDTAPIGTGCTPNFTNVYTNQACSDSSVKVLSDEQMQGAAAVDNMPNLAWYADWMHGDEGEYPTLMVIDYDYWQGGSDTNFANWKKDGDTYIIENVNQLYGMVSSEGKVNGNPASFKVADGIKAFYLSPIKAMIENNVDKDKIINAVKTSSNWNAFNQYDYTANGGFVGNFDGNGVTIYGMNAYATKKVGFIPVVSDEANVTIENVAFKYSYAETSDTATNNTSVVGIVVGAACKWYGSSNSSYKLTFNNVYVQYASSANTYNTVSGLIAWSMYASVNANNCVVADLDSNFTGFGHRGNNNNHVFNNCLSINITSVSSGEFIGSSFNNCYSTLSGDNISNKITVADVTGAAATNLSLDFAGTWFATAGYPQLRVFHDLASVSKGFDGHSEVCADCGLESVVVTPHTLVDDASGKMQHCSVCDFETTKIDTWDGTAADEYAGGSGTEEDPYIIKTPEQLFKMVRSEGYETIDGEKVPLYFKVADGIDALYLNDTRIYADVNKFKAAANAGGLKNWSDGMQYESVKCTDEACQAENKHNTWLYSDSFIGMFDGNGVTIYGLYSKNSNTSAWGTGVGFVPAISEHGTIKNVVFDMAYVENASGYAAVVTSSTGISRAHYNVDGAVKFCKSAFDGGAAEPVLMNIAVRNAYVATGNTSLAGDYGVAAGVLALYNNPAKLTIRNCLFDGNTSVLTTTGTNGSRLAGIFATSSADSYTESITGCLSIDETNNYDVIYSGSRGASIPTVKNSYAYGIGSNSAWGTYALSSTDYTVESMPNFIWSAWKNDADTLSKYGTPMPTTTDSWLSYEYATTNDTKCSSDYKAHIIKGERYIDNLDNDSNSSYNNYGGYSAISGYKSGVFAAFNTLDGSGTENDPYIINDAMTLYQIIASGGLNRGVPQHFKLGCDIDLGNIQWVDTDDYTDSAGAVEYTYKEFAGELDGDGHTIKGMNTITNDVNAGFIPMLAATGVIKNVHIRDSYSYTTGGSYGVLVGTAASGAQIIGCSVDDSKSLGAMFVGTNNGANVTDCYYVNADGSVTYSNGTPTLDGITWYGIAGGKPHLVSHAIKMPYADADGDGKGYEYTANDLSALKSKLLRKSTHANIYGDASRNGVTDIRDMVIMQREIIAMSANDPTSEWEALDGFIRNLKNGKFDIYYNDNDDYDAARKLELYFEDIAPGIDIQKFGGSAVTHVGAVHKTAPSNFAIVLTSSNNAEYDYKVSYDLENAVLTFEGNSFTAVEQAVIDYIAQANDGNGYKPEITGSLTGENAYKAPLSFTYTNDKTSASSTPKYHYVWGDEFTDAVSTSNGDTVSYDKWMIRSKNLDTTTDHKTTFAYIAEADDVKAPSLNTVSGGKLYLNREIASATEYYASGLTSKESMLFKRGYIEVMAQVPADGYSFPAFWLHSLSGNNNREIANSLYGKAYELNDIGEGYNGSLYYKSKDYRTYKYKLPTTFLEIDIFEVIQKLTRNLGGSLTASTDYDMYFNVHKWYNYAKSEVNKDLSFNVYELDWNALEQKLLTDSSAQFSSIDNSLLLSATYSNGTYSASNASITYHSENFESDGSVNSAINENGASKYIEETSNSIMKYKSSSAANTNTNRIYGLLWDDDEITFLIFDENRTQVLCSQTVLIEDLVMSGGNESYDVEQYVYILLDNHFYTAASRYSSWSYAGTAVPNTPMIVDYVRLYQLDGERDIVTSTTEAFNSNNRLGK